MPLGRLAGIRGRPPDIPAPRGRLAAGPAMSREANHEELKMQSNKLNMEVLNPCMTRPLARTHTPDSLQWLRS